MSDLPIISITQDANFHDEIDENDTNYSRNISDCLTDIEDMDSGNEKYDMMAVIKQAEEVGGVTDIEDCDASEDDENDISDGEEFPLSITEFLDQGCINESSNVNANDNDKLAFDMHCSNKSASPSAFLMLALPDEQSGVTDCEDLEGSGEEADSPENLVSSADDAIVLEGQNSIDIQDNLGKKKLQKCNQKAFEHHRSTSSSSESEEEPKPKPHKRYNKKNSKRLDDKSDIEKTCFSNERREKRNSLLSPNGDDAEEMFLEASDVENNMERSPTYPEINLPEIKFSGKISKKGKKTPAKTLMLGLPQNEDEGVTDVENLNSSDSDEQDAASSSRKNSNQLIPNAFIKSHALTDVEDFGEESSDDGMDNDFDLPLPAPVREVVILTESNEGAPIMKSSPLPDQLLLGFNNLDMDKGLTDVEDFSGDDEEGYEKPSKFYIDEPIVLDGGVIESSDRTTDNKGRVFDRQMHEPKTDTEDIFVDKSDCRRRKNRSKHYTLSKQKANSLFVQPTSVAATTDVEDLDVEDDDVVLKDKNIKSKKKGNDCFQLTPRETSGGKTDVEYLSGEEMDSTPPDHSSPTVIDGSSTIACSDYLGSKAKTMAMPVIIKFSAEANQCHTDTEDMQTVSDAEDGGLNVDSYSRAQTATPIELSRDLDDSGASQIHEVHVGIFDHQNEQNFIKGHRVVTDEHTDVEYLDDDGLNAEVNGGN